MLTQLQKSKALIRFANKLRYSQRIIFSDEGNLDSVDKIYYESQEAKVSEKPSGLWYSLGKAWITFLNDPDGVQSWRTKRTAIISHVYQIYPNDTTLKIRTAEDFSRFEAEFATKNKEKIYWRRVANQYNGIEIRFMPWAVHRDSVWYWHWDCSSGCIWDNKAISKIRLLKSWSLFWR